MSNYKKIISLGLLTTCMLSGASVYAAVATAENLLPAGVDQTVINGVNVRKGTIGSFILNINKLGEILQHNPQSKEVADYREHLAAAMPSLQALQVFDLVTIENLLTAKHENGKIHQAKVMAAALYLQQFPAAVNPARKKMLVELMGKVVPVVRAELAKVK